MRDRSRPPIELAQGRDGGLIYQVRLAPDALPPVRSGDLAESWDAARRAASASSWGERRVFRFHPPDREPIDLALTDTDAACWAEAVDAAWGLHTAYGLSLCLRLLGLVTLLAESVALRTLCPLSRTEATLDPALLKAAACVPLSTRGHLDERGVWAHLARSGPPSLYSVYPGALP